VSDPHDPALPAELDLGDDDVVEAVEVVAHDDPPPSADRTSGFDGIGTRREARERALALLFEAEQRGLEPLAAILSELTIDPDAYTEELVRGVSAYRRELDTHIARLSTAWPLERMPAIDRALLRMGAYELSHTDVPVGVCISEAIELAKRYSTDDSHRFINGLLASVASEVRGDQPD
jgi:N utilization substance protein B